MTTKTLEKLWEQFPGSHLHCDVTGAGQDSYRIVVSLVDNMGEVVASVDFYGSGNLDTLKEQAFASLTQKLQQATQA